MSYGCLFNGVNSRIDTGTDMIGIKAVTVMGWIKPYSTGEGSDGQIISNNSFRFATSLTDRISLRSDGSTVVYSAPNSLILNKLTFVAVTRESDGTTNFYIGDKSTPPALSGGADQDSGTPVAGTTNVIIGNNNGQTRTFDGLINKVKVVEGILSLQDITNYWSSSLREIN